MSLTSSLTSQVKSAINDLCFKDDSINASSVLELAKIYGEDPILYGFSSIAFDVLSICNDAEKQKRNAWFLTYQIELLFDDSSTSLFYVASRGFEKVKMMPDMLNRLFEKVKVDIEHQAAIALACVKSNEPNVCVMGKTYLANDTFLKKINDQVKSNNFSERLLHELLYQVQKNLVFTSSQREQVVNRLSEGILLNKKLQKSVRLFVFRHDQFNFKCKFNQNKYLKTLDFELDKKPEPDVFELTKELAPWAFASEKNLKTFLSMYDIKGEKKVSQVIWAFVLSSDSLDCKKSESYDLFNEAYLLLVASGKSQDAQKGKCFISEKQDVLKQNKVQILIRTIKQCFPALKLKKVIKKFDNRNSIQESNVETLLDVLNEMSKNCVDMFVNQLYSSKWKNQQSQYLIIKKGMQYPEQLALRSKSQITTHPKFSVLSEYMKSRETGKKDSLDEEDKEVSGKYIRNFYSLGFITAVLSMSSSSGSKKPSWLCYNSFLPVLDENPLLLYLVLTRINGENKTKSRVLHKIVHRALKAKNTKILIALIRIDTAEFVKIIESIYLRNPEIIIFFYNAMNKTKYRAISLQTLKPLKSAKSEPRKHKEKIFEVFGKRPFTISYAVYEFEQGKFDNLKEWLQCFFVPNKTKEEERKLAGDLQILLRLNLAAQHKFFSQMFSLLKYKTSPLWFYKRATIKELGKIRFKFVELKHVLLGFTEWLDFFETAVAIFEKVKLVFEEKSTPEDLIATLFSEKGPSNQIIFLKLALRETKFLKLYSIEELKKIAKIFCFFVKRDLIPNSLIPSFEAKMIKLLNSQVENELKHFTAIVLLEIVPKLERFPDFCRMAANTKIIQKNFPETLCLMKKIIEKKSSRENTAPVIAEEITIKLKESLANKVRQERAIKEKVAEEEKTHWDVSDAKYGDKKKIEENKAKNKTVIASDSQSDMESSVDDREEIEIRDQVVFLLNNLAESNIISTVEFASEKLHKKTRIEYFARYFVFNKVINQQNFHSTYFKLYRLLERSIRIKIVDFSYTRAKQLLNIEKIAQLQSNEKLSSIGNWLGGILIKNDKPMLIKQIDVKELLIKSFFCSENRDFVLLSVVSFVCKVLSHARQSDIFRPPNPWTMGVIELLKEIYIRCDDGLEMNVRFEIEALAKRLHVDFDNVKNGCLLLANDSSKKLGVEIANQVINQFKEEQAGKLVNAFGTHSSAFSENGVGYPFSQGNLGEFNAYEKEQFAQYDYEKNAQYVNLLRSRVVIDDEYLQLLKSKSAVKLVSETIFRSIMDTYVPLTGRLVSITTETTRELMVKDFGHEPDGEVYEETAMKTVSSLIGNMTLISCRDTLWAEIFNNLVTVLKPLIKDKTAMRNMASSLAKSNYLIGCQFVSEFAIDQAKIYLMSMIGETVEQRKKMKNSQLLYPGELYFTGSDPKQMLYPNCLPFELQPRRGGLSEDQKSHYEDYVPLYSQHLAALAQWKESTDFKKKGEEEERRAREISLGAENKFSVEMLENFKEYDSPKNGKSEGTEILSSGFPELSEHHKNISKSTTQETVSMEKMNVNNLSNLESVKMFQNSQAMFEYEVLVKRVKSVPHSSKTSLSSLPKDHEIFADAEKVLAYVKESLRTKPEKGKVLFFILADHVYSEMFHLASNCLFLDVSVHLLKEIDKCCSEKLITRITRFYLNEEDRKKYNLDIFTRLIKNQFLDVHFIDMYFSDKMSAKDHEAHTRAVYFVAAFFNLLVIEEKCFSMDDFPKIVRVFRDFSRQKLVFNASNILFRVYFRKIEEVIYSCDSDGSSYINDPHYRFTAKNETSLLLFKEWMSVFESEPERVSFLRERLMPYITNASVIRDLVEMGFDGSAGEVTKASTALSKLVVCVEKEMSFLGPEFEKKTLFLKLVLMSIADYVTSQQEDGNLDQRPVYKVLMTFIVGFDLRNYSILLTLLLECLTHLSPIKAPGFTLAWFSLFGNKHFLTPILELQNFQVARQCRFRVMKLFCQLFVHLEQFYLKERFDSCLRRLSVAIMRVLIAFFTNYPSFLAEFYFDLCSNLPPLCLQMKNAVLSAVPAGVEPGLYQYNNLASLLGPEPVVSPGWLFYLCKSDLGENGDQSLGIKQDLDIFINGDINACSIYSIEFYRKVNKKLLKPKQGRLCQEQIDTIGNLGDFSFDEDGSIIVSASVESKNAKQNFDFDLKTSEKEAELFVVEDDTDFGGCFYDRFRYDRHLVNSVVAYVGTQVLARLKSEARKNPQLDILSFLNKTLCFFSHLVRVADFEGKYLVISALMDHLRYYSSHTHLFSLAVLTVFAMTDEKEVKEIFFRVILERLASFGPHPKGLISLFREFAKNPYYNAPFNGFFSGASQTMILYNTLFKRYCQSTENEDPVVDDLDDLNIESK